MVRARRQNGALSSSKACAAELAVRRWATIVAPGWKGLDLDHVRPCLRQGYLSCHPGSASRGKRIAVWPKEPNGALKGAIS